MGEGDYIGEEVYDLDTESLGCLIEATLVLRWVRWTCPIAREGSAEQRCSAISTSRDAQQAERVLSTERPHKPSPIPTPATFGSRVFPQRHILTMLYHPVDGLLRGLHSIVRRRDVVMRGEICTRQREGIVTGSPESLHCCGVLMLSGTAGSSSIVLRAGTCELAAGYRYAVLLLMRGPWSYVGVVISACCREMLKTGCFSGLLKGADAKLQVFRTSLWLRHLA